MSSAVIRATVLGLLSLCGGCAEITAQPVDNAQYKITEVCIQLNKQPVPADFKYILKEGFLRHGIAMQDYTDELPRCEHWLSYSVVTQKGHASSSLRDVHLALHKGSVLIAYADRDSPKGFLGKEVGDLSQWDTTRSILDPLVDSLLDGYQSPSVK